MAISGVRVLVGLGALAAAAGLHTPTTRRGILLRTSDCSDRSFFTEHSNKNAWVEVQGEQD